LACVEGQYYVYEIRSARSPQFLGSHATAGVEFSSIIDVTAAPNKQSVSVPAVRY